MVTGIILPKGLKHEFRSSKVADLFLETRNNQLGIVDNDGNIVWERWDKEVSNSLAFAGNTIENGLIIDPATKNEFKVKFGTSSLIKWGLTFSEADNKIIKKTDAELYLGYNGDYNLDSGYIPVNDNDLATNSYLVGELGDFILKNEYSHITQKTEPKAIITLQWLLDNLEKIPTFDPIILGYPGMLWYDEVQNKFLIGGEENYKFAIRVWNTSTPSISVNGGSVNIEDHGDGSYLVTSEDPISWFKVNSSTVTKVHLYNTETVTSMIQSFSGLSYLSEFTSEKESNTKNVTDFKSAWFYCTSLTSFPQLDMSSGINFYGTWFYCTSLTSFPQLDISNGITFESTWYGCSSLTSFPQLDVSSGTNFSYTWEGCSSLTSFPQLDVSKGTNFSYAWDSCSSLTSFPQLNVSNGTNFFAAWERCESLTLFPQLNVSNGTNFFAAWAGCTSLTSFPQLDVSNGTNFNAAWSNCNSLSSFPQLDVSNGTNFGGAWAGCTSLTSFPQLDVSNGTNFNSAWNGCSGLTSFPQLDVSSGTDFTYTWNNCTSLPHCPAGNEVTIPAGATTTDMCTGI